MIPWEWWGRGLPYGEAWARQGARREAILQGHGGECLALLEHRAVVTYGRRPAPGNPCDEELLARGLDVFHTERGGLATWHGPGQLVGYLLCATERRGLRVRDVVEGLEEGLTRWLRGLGIHGERRCGAPGVWLREEKIAAIGLNFSRGVSMHGFALNLRLGPDAYAGIVPCGYTELGVTSVASQRGEGAPEPQEAAPQVASAVLAALSERAGP